MGFYHFSALYMLIKFLYSHNHRALIKEMRDRNRIQIDMEFHHSHPVLYVRARSTALVHGTDILRPYPMDDEEYDEEYDGYIQ